MDTTIVFAADMPAATITARVHRGELARLAPGVYTTDTTSALVTVAAREWPRIAGRLFPGAVITDRSAVTGGPADGVLYLARDGRAREVDLPGLRVTARPGARPLDGDIPLPEGLYQASKGRALAENTRPSRSAAAGNDGPSTPLNSATGSTGCARPTGRSALHTTGSRRSGPPMRSGHRRRG